MKPVFFSLTNPSPDEERDRSRDFCRSIDEEKVDLDDESDGNDHLNLESEHNDDDLDLSHISLIQRIELVLHNNLGNQSFRHTVNSSLPKIL